MGTAHLSFESLHFSPVLKLMSYTWQRHNPRVTKRARQIQLLSFLKKPDPLSLSPQQASLFFFSITTAIWASKAPKLKLAGENRAKQAVYFWIFIMQLVLHLDSNHWCGIQNLHAMHNGKLTKGDPTVLWSTLNSKGSYGENILWGSGDGWTPSQAVTVLG